MFVIYDPSSAAVVSTMDMREGVLPPGGAWIEVPARPMGDLADWRVEGGTLVRASIAGARAAAVSWVNGEIGQRRHRYVTVIEGQEMIYLEKRAEALRYLAAVPEPRTLGDYPLLAAEVGITAPTAWQLAQVWANQAAMLVAVAASLERLRLGTIKALEEATTETEIETALSLFRQQLAEV